jgi:hypothetical protein
MTAVADLKRKHRAIHHALVATIVAPAAAWPLAQAAQA